MEQDKIASLDWEEWRDIPGYEWYYMVSNFGRIKSIPRFIDDKWWIRAIPMKILKSFNNWKSYQILTLNKHWEHHTFKIHRLVASAFLWLDIYNKYICVCHKDDNPSNNKLSNLFLWTHKDNVQDMKSKWRWNYLYWLAHHKSHQVLQYNIDWNFIKEWGSICIANRELWISRQWIMLCCKWKLKTSWWFVWEYKRLEDNVTIDF